MTIQKLKLVFHSELNDKQQEKVASIYLDYRNWGNVIVKDTEKRSINLDSSLTDLIVNDALSRDNIFPYGQIVLLSKEEEWVPIGSINTVVSSTNKVKECFDKYDAWNFFNNNGRLSPSTYVKEGDRWICFAIQTDYDIKKKYPEIKPGDLILKAVKLLSFNKAGDNIELNSTIEFSEDFRNAIGKHKNISYINPLTRLSGYSKFHEKYNGISAFDYAENIKRITSPNIFESSSFDSDLRDISKTCSLRYHLSRGAVIEKVIENFRVNDISSLGYGASVLYSR